MIPLFKHFIGRCLSLRNSYEPAMPLLAAIPIYAIFSFTSVRMDVLGLAVSYGTMAAAILGFAQAARIWQPDEFDLSLPFGRGRIYVAKNLATVVAMLTSFIPVTIALTILSVTMGISTKYLLFFGQSYLLAVSLVLIAIPVLRYRWRARLAVLLIFGGGVWGAFIGLTRTFIKNEPMLTVWPSAVAVALGAAGWFIGRRQYCRWELVPKPESGASFSEKEPAPSRTISLPSSPAATGWMPFLRLMSHALWFRWWYMSLILYLAASSLFVRIDKMFVWVFIPAIAVIFLRQVYAQVAGLQPLISRVALLRSVMLPIIVVAGAALSLLSLRTGSSSLLATLAGFVFALAFVLWSTIPGRRDYTRPLILHFRQFWIVLVIIGPMLLYAQMNRIKTALAPYIERINFGLPSDYGYLILLIAAAILWWRAERKFRYYEAPVLPTYKSLFGNF